MTTDFVRASLLGDDAATVRLAPLSVHDGSEKGRLLRRAHVIARAHHPNLARMLPLPGGAGLSPVSNGASRLAEFSASGVAFRGLELGRLVWVLLDVLSGLRALHEVEFEGAPFVHGAVSPQYILLGEPGSARLVPLTNAHLMPNAPSEPSGYVAPELLLGERADRRADLFSVGVLLWEALAECRLFPDGSPDAVLDRLDRGEVPRLNGLARPSWALPLCRVAERVIAIAPSTRFGSALEFSSAIVAAAGRQLTSPPSERRTADVESVAPESRTRPSRWRNVTPPATVIDLPPPPTWDLDSVTHLAPPRLIAQLLEPDWSSHAHSQVVQPVRRVPRQVAWAAAGLVACVGWLLHAAHKSPIARQPMAAALTVPEPKPATKLVDAPPSPSASSRLAARSAAPAASIAPATERQPQLPSPAALKRQTKLNQRSDRDYGI